MVDGGKLVIFYDTLNQFQKKDFDCMKRDYVTNLIHSLGSRNGSDNEVVENYRFFDFYDNHLGHHQGFCDFRLTNLVRKIFEESKKERILPGYSVVESVSGDDVIYSTYEDRLERIKKEVENDSAVIEYEYKDI